MLWGFDYPSDEDNITFWTEKFRNNNFVDIQQSVVGFKAFNDVNYSFQTRFGQITLLHIAIEHASLKVIEYLIENGASVNSSSKINTPLLKALGLSRFDVARCLIENEALVDSSIYSKINVFKSLDEQKLNFIEYLLTKGIPVDLNTTDHFTIATIRRIQSTINEKKDALADEKEDDDFILLNKFSIFDESNSSVNDEFVNIEINSVNKEDGCLVDIEMNI